jgi:glycosyltransferase involved in cell wall biosynthesis
MKILLIHNKYQSNNIGGEDVVYENELVSLQKKLGNNNVFFYEVSNDDISKIKLLFTIWFSFKHYKNIKKIVKENNIDIVHIHNFFPILTPSVFKAAKDSGAKVIHTLHNYRIWCISGLLYRNNYGICEDCLKNNYSIAGILNKCYRNSFIQSILAQKAFWFYKITKVFDNNIDYYFVLTSFQKDKLKSLGVNDNKILINPNSIDVPFNIKKEKENYVYVGRLEQSKGIVELLRAWKQLDEKFVLVIIGSGELEDTLKKEFKSKNIIFKGKCSREETLENISRSKYLIQSSFLYETFGLTILEAMSFGVPVIGFDIGTRSNLIIDEVNGFLIKPENLKSTIERSYEYKNYQDLSRNALKTAKLYENNIVIEKQIEIYNQILNQPSNETEA